MPQLNEFEIIKNIEQNFHSQNKSIIKSIGDDCSVHTFSENENLIISKDLLVENIHFDLDFITPFQLGYKSIAVNISDIAAMGGIPENIFLGLAIPKKLDNDFLNEFFDGIKAITRKYCINITGGDTSGSTNDFFISVTITGKSFKENKFFI